MTKSQLKALQELSHEGYAVCVFCPEELEGANPHHVEDNLCSHGWEVIASLKACGEE
jgi:hypothetical protein